MCGIFGVASRFDGQVAKIILEGLKKLEYRGYDSVGIATVFKDRIYLKKSSGKIRELEKKLHFENLPGKVGIGHTRWATHGIPNDINSHPHTDCKGTIAIVHNGILENYLELKKFLLKKGHFFRSDTDTEVFAHLLEEYVKEEDSFFNAFKRALKMIKGSYAFAIITTFEPNKIFFARKH
ncbi:MAG: glutamine--fructose-6-phosphate aminotransferase, partial [Thermoprotei archaeon]